MPEFCTPPRLTTALTHRLRRVRAFLLDMDGVLTDGGLQRTDQTFDEKVVCVMDRDSIRAAQRLGILFGLITGHHADIIRHRAVELRIRDLYTGSLDKSNAYEDFKRRYNLRDEEIAYMGDEIFDVSLLKRVGFAAAPANGHRAARMAAHYVTTQLGGHGAVREVMTLLIHAHGVRTFVPRYEGSCGAHIECRARQALADGMPPPTED
jgi:3-deoxy-D-manno-octulosonate 8-phosphate phosphatase (KDO 8-P phosphatase)